MYTRLHITKFIKKKQKDIHALVSLNFTNLSHDAITCIRDIYYNDFKSLRLHLGNFIHNTTDPYLDFCCMTILASYQSKYQMVRAILSQVNNYFVEYHDTDQIEQSMSILINYITAACIRKLLSGNNDMFKELMQHIENGTLLYNNNLLGQQYCPILLVNYCMYSNDVATLAEIIKDKSKYPKLSNRYNKSKLSLIKNFPNLQGNFDVFKLLIDDLKDDVAKVPFTTEQWQNIFQRTCKPKPKYSLDAKDANILTCAITCKILEQAKLPEDKQISSLLLNATRNKKDHKYIDKRPFFYIYDVLRKNNISIPLHNTALLWLKLQRRLDLCMQFFPAKTVYYSLCKDNPKDDKVSKNDAVYDMLFKNNKIECGILRMIANYAKETKAPIPYYPHKKLNKPPLYDFVTNKTRNNLFKSTYSLIFSKQICQLKIDEKDKELSLLYNNKTNVKKLTL